MKDKKNIDRLFQENFKDFEEAPSPKVWKNIERELKGRKKRRVIPLWYKIGGVAAALALLFFAGNEVFNNQSSMPVVNGDQQRSVPEQTIKSEANDILSDPENSVGANSTDSSITTSSNKQSIVSSETEHNSNQNTSEGKKEKNSVLNTSASEKTDLNKSESAVSVASNSAGNGRKNAAEAPFEASKTQKENKQNNAASEVTNRESQLASTEQKTKVDSLSRSASEDEKDRFNSTSLVAETWNQGLPWGLIPFNRQNEKATSEKQLSDENNGNNKPSEGLANQNNEKFSEVKKGINSEKENNSISVPLENRLAGNETANKSALDTTQLANAAKNDSVGKKSLLATAEALQEQKEADEEDEKEKTNPSKWLVSPSVSPIYYSSLNGGNTVDPKFNGSQGKGEVTMAYGINFAYQLSDKLKIRSGVSKVNMGYKTNDIAFTSSVDAMALKGVNNSATAESIEVLSQSEAATYATPHAREVSGNKVNSFSTGSISQQFGFLEVPVEIEYALLDKRFGINLIGGASTLFLNNNDVTINSAQGTTDLGEANNINKVSFTTNIGIGFGYEITKKFGVKLEPTFKYQLNGFSGDTNGFQPYYFGVYTGFRFKF